MKKIIYVLFTIELLIVSLLGLNIVKDNEINNILYNDTTSISVMFKDYKKFNKNYSKWIKDIADENNVTISKYVFNNNEKLSIYTTDTSLNNNIKLKSGEFPNTNTNSNEFISNINTNNSNQVGKFSTMSKDISILIRDFDKISEVGESGILYISTQNKDTINKILKELNVDRSIFVARLHDRYVNSNLYLNPSIIRDLILIILCFLATIIHYSISVSREASILRLNGYSKLDIITRVIRSILRIMILSSITSLLIYIIYILKLNLGVRACLYFVIFSIICILINIFISILIVGFNIRSSKYVLTLNGKKPYGFVNIIHFTLKIVFVSFLILSINNCILNYNILQTQLGNLSEWDKAKNVYNLTLKDTGEQSLGKEEVIKNAKIKGFYKSLVEEKDAFLIDTTNFEKLENGSYMYEINSKGKKPEVSQYGKNIKINKNYLKVNPIYSNGKKIFNLIDYDDKTINLLVPKKLQVHENEIKKEFRELFYFEKIEVENMYNEELNRDLNKTKKSDLNVNIIYVDNNQSYFTYNSLVMDDNRNLINDPIAIVDIDNIDDSFYLSYISRCVYFNSKKLDALADISKIIEAQGVEANIQSLRAVYNEYGLEINKLEKYLNSEIFTIIIIAISNLMITYNIVVSYYERNKYKLYIKKIFGYSATARSILLIISLILTNVIPIGIISTRVDLSNNIVLFGLLILVVEVIISIILDKIISNSSFNKIIKGEH